MSTGIATAARSSLLLVAALLTALNFASLSAWCDEPSGKVGDRADEGRRETTLDSVDADADAGADDHSNIRLRGRVVFLAEAMQRLHGVKTVDESREAVLALETANGELFPLVEDVRGRAFRRDERLRKMEVDLLVRRYQGVPSVQIIRVFEVSKDGLAELDYWCEICAIAMFELKPCDCCQGDIELRRRPVKTPRDAP